MTKYSNLLYFKLLFLSFIFTSLYNHCHSCIFLDTIRTKIILCFLHCIEEFSWLCIRKNPKRSGLTTELCTKKQMVTEMCRCLIFKWFSIPVCATVYTSDPWNCLESTCAALVSWFWKEDCNDVPYTYKSAFSISCTWTSVFSNRLMFVQMLSAFKVFKFA